MFTMCKECYIDNSRITPLLNPVDCLSHHTQYICGTCGLSLIHILGTTLFVGVKVGKVKIETVFRQLLIYFAAIFVVLMLVTYIPQLSLWLPSLMGYV